MRRVAFEVEGLQAERAVEKVRAAGIPVLSAQKPQKNAVRIVVNGKHYKKVFAILRSSCYNIKKVRAMRLERLVQAGVKTAGIFVGGVLALLSVFFFESRVLRVEVTGSGAYYEAEIRDILAENGVTAFAPAPKKTEALASRILALPRVSFCTVRAEAGVVTVRVEVSGEVLPLEEGPLTSPAAGVLEELVVVRGTPLRAIGDEVAAGEVLVQNIARYGGTEREVAVIARAAVKFQISATYELGEAGAVFQAFLDYGELGGIHTEKTESGVRVLGTARRQVSLNFG